MRTCCCGLGIILSSPGRAEWLNGQWEHWTSSRGPADSPVAHSQAAFLGTPGCS